MLSVNLDGVPSLSDKLVKAFKEEGYLTPAQTRKADMELQAITAEIRERKDKLAAEILERSRSGEINSPDLIPVVEAVPLRRGVCVEGG